MADDYMNTETPGSVLVSAGWGEVFGHKGVLVQQRCREYRIGDKLQIRHWQMTRSGEIKTSRRHLQSISKTWRV